jgi:HEAT repeat protein
MDALLQTLREDSSVDVRLAALDALTRYGGRPDVRKGLIDALEGQQSPLVQVALIDALVDIHGTGAIQQLKKLQQDPKADPSVRKHAEWGVAQLS